MDPKWDWNVRFTLGGKDWIRADGPGRECVEYSVRSGFFRLSGFEARSGATYVPGSLIRSILDLAAEAGSA